MFKGTVSRDGFGFRGTCMVSWVGLNRGWGQSLDFFRCPNDFIRQKVYFSRLMRALANNVCGVYLKVHKHEIFVLTSAEIFDF